MRVVKIHSSYRVWKRNWFSTRLMLSLPALLWLLIGPFWFAYIYTTEDIPIGPDAAKYLMSGALSANGHTTYKYLFAPKPPGSHLVTSALHLVFENRLLIYFLTVAAMLATVALTAWLVSVFVYDYTGSKGGAIGAALVLFGHEAFATVWMHGWMGKYAVILLAIGSFLLATRGHPLLAVAIATLAPAFWQFALPTPFLTMAIGLDTYPAEVRPRLEYLLECVLAMTTVTALVTLPYILAGAASHLIAQVVVIPLIQALAGEGGNSLYLWLSMVSLWDLSLPVFALGVTGLGLLFLDARGQNDPVAVSIVSLAAWFLVIGLFAGQHGPLDMIPVVPLVAIGVGVLIGFAPRQPLSALRQTLPEVSIQTVVLLVVGVWLSLAILRFGFYPPYVYAGHELGFAYLDGVEPATCHAANNRIGQWVSTAGLGSTGRECNTLAEVVAELRGG